MRVLWPLLLVTVTSAQLQCPTDLPSGSKYLVCLAGGSTPQAQPEPFPVRLGQPGINFLQNYAGVSGATAVRLFRSVDTCTKCDNVARCLVYIRKGNLGQHASNPQFFCCRRQALDFFFTYFHLNYEESLIPPGNTIQELAAVSPGPKNSKGEVIWNMQAYALDLAGDLPSLRRLCNAFGCATLSAGQVPVYIGGYQLQVQQPFTAVGLLLKEACL